MSSMATLTFEFPDRLRAKAEARAAEAGFTDLAEFFSQILFCEIVGAPEAQTVRSDADLEALLSSRIDGPWVEVNTADFQQMREKFKASLDNPEKQS